MIRTCLKVIPFVLLALFIGCGGGSKPTVEVDPVLDLAEAVKTDIQQMKNAEAGAAGEAQAFFENMASRVENAPEEHKAIYQDILAKAEEMAKLAESGADDSKLEPLVKEIEDLANQLPGQAPSE